MKHTTEKYMKRCGCRSVGECSHNMMAPLVALDKCVDGFAKAMKAKLKAKLYEGRSGWDDPEWTTEQIWQRLLDHIDKGDPVDVANFAMFVWNKEQP